MTKQIPFTQFLTPSGKTQPLNFDHPTDESFEKATRIMAAGFRFEIEMLSFGGMISATISDDNGDWGSAIAENGPPLVDAINDMIMKFDTDKAKQMSDEVAEDNSLNDD